MRVLFVGASGAVGRGVVPSLSTDFDLALAGLESGQLDALPVAALDLRDFDATLELVMSAGADAVVNCAVADYRKFRKRGDRDQAHDYHENTIDVNVRGAYHLYEAAARAGVSKFVFISSMTVISGQPLYDRPTGDDPARPSNIYACTKVFGEHLGEVYSAEHGMSVSCLRLGQPYPLNCSHDLHWVSDPWARGFMVHMEDIASSIGAALRQTAPFATYSVVSDSDSPWLREVAIGDIGYEPRYRFDSSHPQPLELTRRSL